MVDYVMVTNNNSGKTYVAVGEDKGKLINHIRTDVEVSFSVYFETFWGIKDIEELDPKELQKLWNMYFGIHYTTTEVLDAFAVVQVSTHTSVRTNGERE